MAPVSGHIHFWNAAGLLLHSEPLSLGARASLSLNTGGITAPAAQAGSITVAHDGGYGGLVGKSVSLELATGYSFDSVGESRRRQVGHLDRFERAAP